MEYKIEKGIEIPSRRKNSIKYPWDEMEIGDSFIISNEYSPKLIRKYSACAKSWASYNKNGYSFSLRKVPEGIRIWRVK